MYICVEFKNFNIMKLKKYNNGGTVKLQNAGKVPEAVVTAYAPSINTKQGKIAAQNMAARLLSGQDNTGRVPSSYYNYVTGELNGAIPVSNAISKAGQTVASEASPYVIGAAFGPVGLLSAFAGEGMNSAVTGFSHGDKNSWGEVLKAQNGTITTYPTASTKSFLQGTMDYILRRKNPKSFIKSLYRPSVGDQGETYYTRDRLKNEVALSLFGGTDALKKNALGNNYFYKDFNDAWNKLSVHNDSRHASNGTLGNYAVSAGQDDRGKYISFADKFDFVVLPGKPIHIYDRIYEDEWRNLYNSNDSAMALGDAISKSPILKKLYKYGGIIKNNHNMPDKNYTPPQSQLEQSFYNFLNRGDWRDNYRTVASDLSSQMQDPSINLGFDYSDDALWDRARQNWRIIQHPYIYYEKQGGVLKAQPGGSILPYLPQLALKKGFELVAKRSNGAQGKSVSTIAKDVITGRDKSFYSMNTIDGGNEIDTYLYGVPYGTEFVGDESIGPDYSKYIAKNYPGRNIKTYNAHFGDTLYIDEFEKGEIEQLIKDNGTVGGSMGRYSHAPSYIVSTKEGRPYDAGGHLMKFSKDKNGNIVANMSDIYDFNPSDFNEKYFLSENPSWTRNLANNVGTPFIVRQNNIPVVFKKIMPDYQTEKQWMLGDFLSQWGDMYDLNVALELSDDEIDSIFKDRQYGDDILDYMDSKGWLRRKK